MRCNTVCHVIALMRLNAFSHASVLLCVRHGSRSRCNGGRHTLVSRSCHTQSNSMKAPTTNLFKILYFIFHIFFSLFFTHLHTYSVISIFLSAHTFILFACFNTPFSPEHPYSHTPKSMHQ